MSVADFRRAGIAATRNAGLIVRGGSCEFCVAAIQSKGRGDVVSDMDHQADHAIVTRLGGAFPDHAFLDEESGTSGAVWRWIIDPLDGTLNFAHGRPHFRVSIALVHNHAIITLVLLNLSQNRLAIPGESIDPHKAEKGKLEAAHSSNGSRIPQDVGGGNVKRQEIELCSPEEISDSARFHMSVMTSDKRASYLQPRTTAI